MAAMDIILLALMELAMLLVGVYGCLVGFRIYQGGAKVDRAAWERWYNATGHWLRFVGPFGLLVALALPLIFAKPAWLPAWAPGASALALLSLVLVFAVVTWRWTPKVGWPKGITAWLVLLWLEPLAWSGVAMGILDFLGLDGRPFADHRLWAWYLGGLVFARLRQVWFTRFLHAARMKQGVHARRRTGPLDLG